MSLPASEIDISRLLEFLELLDEEMPRKITLVAVGGTAMTLLKVKRSTRDINFTGPGKDIDLFKRVLKTVPHGMKVDTWADGRIFSQFLPSDYMMKSVKVKQFKNIDLRALHPLDIVVTKVGRLDERDERDIRDCIRAFRLSKSDVEGRAHHVEYVGNLENYEYQLHLAMRRCFD